MRLSAIVALCASAAVLIACGEAQASGSIQVNIETSTPTPTATPTPEPTEVPWPIPAERIAPGDSAGLSNPASEGFPRPAPSTELSAPNEGRIVRIVAPALGLDHHITVLGVTDGMMDAPGAEESTHAVGWYIPGSGGYDFGTPGEAENSVFAAHESWNHEQGPFYLLHTARIGDEIYLDMEGGERRHYQVARVTRYLVTEMPMKEVLWPSDRPEHEEWLTLYTCGGEIVYGANGFGDYLARDVLVAKWVGSSRTPDTTSTSTTGATLP
ncbi:MAG: class F sortase [Dehalococcoidia bacterium]|nr:class F sortase [Dehalococcoidia bacterium]